MIRLFSLRAKRPRVLRRRQFVRVIGECAKKYYLKILKQVQDDSMYPARKKRDLLYMKKYLIPSILFAAIAASLFGGWSQAAVPASVSGYLATLKNNEWAVMAQAALGGAPGDVSFLKTPRGGTANDYSKTILALTALGKDPRFFGPEDLVSGLRQKFNNGQMGDASLLSDDMFGIIALRAAGAPADDAVIVKAAAYLKSKQLADGSWDFSAGSSRGSADFAAMGIMALRAAGLPASDPVLKTAIDYLQKSQNDDGGWPIAPAGLSNTESTAWVLSAIYALGDNPLFWVPKSASPVDYLNARLRGDGYYLFDASSTTADVRTPVTTSYAAIALSGKFYPVQIISAPTAVNLRIEGQDSTLCEAKAEGRTVLDAVKSGAVICNYTYVIEDTQYGPYLSAINSEAAAGARGWSYLVNYDLAMVGMADYAVKGDDNVILYYGSWDDLPLRVTHAAAVGLGASSAAAIEKYDYNQKQWLAAGGVVLKRGSESWTIGADGRLNLSWPQAGAYQIWAEGAYLARSAKIAVTVGAGSNQSQSLALSAEITQATGGGPAVGDDSNPPAGPGGGNTTPAVVFGVSGDLNFGKLKPGESATKTVVITNSSMVQIKVTATVAGARLFTDNLLLDEKKPAAWEKRLETNMNNMAVNAKLTVPASYALAGKEQGTLIFWANPAQ